jgi:hypothetical protein
MDSRSRGNDKVRHADTGAVLIAVFDSQSISKKTFVSKEIRLVMVSSYLTPCEWL